MRVLVTGSTGFVGSHLMPALSAAGHGVSVFVRNPGQTDMAQSVVPEGITR